MHSAQSHLLGNSVDAKVGIVHIGINHLHHLLHQFVVGSLHIKVFDVLFLGFHTLHLVAHHVSRCHEIEQGALQDVQVEWFHDICVGTCFQSLQLFFVARFCRQQHHWNHVCADIVLQFGTQSVTIHNRHHDVAHHDVRHILKYAGKCILTIAVCRYLE